MNGAASTIDAAKTARFARAGRAMRFLALLAVAIAALECKDSTTGPRADVIAIHRARFLLITGGDTVTFQVLAHYSDGSLVPQAARWTSSDSFVAAVNQAGLVTSRAIGSARIIATTRDTTLTDAVDVLGHVQSDRSVDSVVLHGTLLSSLYALDSVHARVMLPGRWSSADSSIARSDAAGKLFGVAVGHTKVTGRYGQDSVVVVAAVAPLLVVTPAVDTLFLSDSVQLGVSATDSQGNPTATPAPITWTNSNAMVATVTSSGLVRAIGVGPAEAIAHFDWATKGTPLGTTPRYVSIAAGNQLGCGLDSASVAWCWYGGVPIVMGDGKTDSARMTSAAQKVQGAPPLSDVGAGDGVACGRGSDSRAYCWQLGAMAAAEGPAGLPARFTIGYLHRCAWSSGGPVACWLIDPLSNYGQAADPSPHTFSDLAAGSYHTCGVEGGTALCWGDAIEMRLGSVVTTTGCGGYTDVQCTPTPLVVPGLPPVASVTAGYDASCALTAGGTAWCWGSNAYGQLGSGDSSGAYAPRPVAGGLHWKEIAIGFHHMCGITTASDVYCWGEMETVGSTTVTPYTPCTDRLTGELHRCWFTPAPVQGLKASSIRSSIVDSCILRSDGMPICWFIGTWM